MILAYFQASLSITMASLPRRVKKKIAMICRGHLCFRAIFGAGDFDDESV
jgi:hypothetical protein